MKKIGIGNLDLKGKKVLDIGCGDGGDVSIFEDFGANVIGIDIIPNQNWRLLNKNNSKFIIANGCDLPFKDETFDIVFEKDMLHHVREPEKVLSEIKRVAKKGGQIIIIEANRYNPVLYLHMTLIRGHQHLTYRYFKKLISNTFNNVKFEFLEVHVYPKGFRFLSKIYELIMEKFLVFKKFLAYNCAIIRNDK